MLVYTNGRSPEDSDLEVLRLDDNPLTLIERLLEMEQDRRHVLEGRWFDNVLFAYGYQHKRGRYDTIARAPYSGDPSGSGRHKRLTFNITLRVVQEMVAALTQNAPKLRAVPKKRDWRTRQAARYAQDLLAHAEMKLKLDRMRQDIAYYLGPMGNCFVHAGWNYEMGRQFQGVGPNGPGLVSEGALWAKVVSPIAAYAHPQAVTLDESPSFVWRMTVSRDWARTTFRSKWKEIMSAPSVAESDHLYDLALITLLPGAGASRAGAGGYPRREDGFIEIFLGYFRPTPEYERGRMVYALGSRTRMIAKLYDSEESATPGNPHVFWEDGRFQGGIPFVHFKAIPAPNVFWGANIVDIAREPQTEINLRQTQAAVTANSSAMSPVLAPATCDQLGQTLSNEPDRIYKIPQQLPWLPYRLQPADMPGYALKLAEDARGYLNYAVAPFGPDSMELPKNLTSGIQQAQYIELQQAKIRPLADAFRASYADLGRLIIRTVRNFQRVPKAFEVPDENGWRESIFAGADLGDDIEVIAVPDSNLPSSRVATEAIWLERFKVGAANPADPVTMKRYWNDVRMGDMNDTLEDAAADIEKANRNIARVQRGEVVIAGLMDDPRAHLSVYRQYMKSDEYEKLPEQVRQLMLLMVESYEGLQQYQLMRQTMMMMAQAGMTASALQGGGGGGSSNPVQAAAATIAPGAPQGGRSPKATQGMSASPNPMRPQGG